jgi:hypothetical protein
MNCAKYRSSSGKMFGLREGHVGINDRSVGHWKICRPKETYQLLCVARWLLIGSIREYKYRLLEFSAAIDIRLLSL